MGSELLKIAEGFSIVAEGLRGLAKAEGGTKEKAVKAQHQGRTTAWSFLTSYRPLFFVKNALYV